MMLEQAPTVEDVSPGATLVGMDGEQIGTVDDEHDLERHYENSPLYGSGADGGRRRQRVCPAVVLRC